MRQSEIHRLMDMLDDLKKIDALIDTHIKLDDSGFMVSQYEAKKVKLIANIIDCLASPAIQSPQSFSIIESILLKYYPLKDKGDLKYDDDMAQLAASI